MPTKEEILIKEKADLVAEIVRLRAAVREAQHLIDNDLVCPWIMAHKLDDVLK